MKKSLYYIVFILMSMVSNEAFCNVQIDGIYYNLKSDNTAEVVNLKQPMF